jgi:hypothetical protein
MSIFRNVRFQRGCNSPVDDVKVTVRQGLFPDLGVITFSATTGFKDHIEDASAFNDRGANKTELRIIFETEEDILLTFQNEVEKEEFAVLLNFFLGNCPL